MNEAVRRRHVHGTPCWTSLMVHDLDASRAFYHGLFGWEFHPVPQPLGPYVRAVRDGQEVAGLGEPEPGGHFRIAWMPYLASDDADATAELIRLCGGTVAIGPLDAGDTGRLAVAADPVGAPFGVWQGGSFPGLSMATGGPGTPVWFELITRNTVAVSTFYRAVFGYEADPVAPDEGDYVALRLERREVAGVHGVGEVLDGEMPRWETFFAVEDTDAAVHRVAELGGATVRAPHETPYGRRATVADPEGALFSLIAQA